MGLHNVLSNREAEPLAGNLDTSLLKLLALCLMLVDHLGATVFRPVFELRLIGRMAMPLYAWCIVVGSVKTRNPARYLGRLLLLGVLSQPLYMMALNHSVSSLNILFTLSLGMMGIWGMRERKYGSHIWAPVLCLLVACFVSVDYGWRGVLFIYLLYGARKTRGGLAATLIAYGLFWGLASGGGSNSQLFGLTLPWVGVSGLNELISPFFRTQAMIWLSLPLILIPTHSHVHMPHWLGYSLYPAHLVILIAVKLLSGVDWSTMLAVFR